MVFSIGCGTAAKTPEQLPKIRGLQPGLRFAVFLSILGVAAWLAAPAAYAGTLTSATWTQVTQGFSMTRTGGQLGITGMSTGSSSISAALSYPALATKFFIPKTANGVLHLAVSITQGGPQALTATQGMAFATMGVPGTWNVRTAAHNSKGVSESTFMTGPNTLVMVPLSVGVGGQRTGPFTVLGVQHLQTVGFYGWTPGTLIFTGLTNQGGFQSTGTGGILPDVTAMGSFNLTAGGGGTVTLVSPSKISIDCSLLQRRTVSFSTLKMWFLGVPVIGTTTTTTTTTSTTTTTTIPPCTDVDADGACEPGDNCPGLANPGQEDLDGDGIGDACDACTDVDADGACEPGDNCPLVANPGQEDADGDGTGDACDACTDVDADGACEPGDNCPGLANPGQEDVDSDGIGDACDSQLAERDLFATGDGKLSYDPATGLDWLDLTETTGLSYDAIEGDASQWISRGFRHATGAEVCALLSNYGSAPSPCPDNGTYFSATGPVNLFEFLQSRLGITTYNPPTAIASLGLYNDGTPGPNVGQAQFWREDDVDNSRSSVYVDHVASTAPDPSGGPTGHFLVLDGATPSDFDGLEPVAYLEDFAGESSIAGLTPEVDPFDFGPLLEGASGNGPFTAVSLSGGSALSTVENTNPTGALREIKSLGFPGEPSSTTIGVRGRFQTVLTPVNAHGYDLGVTFSDPLGTSFVSAGIDFDDLGSGKSRALTIGWGSGLSSLELPGPIADAIDSGESFDVALTLADLDQPTWSATAELSVPGFPRVRHSYSTPAAVANVHAAFASVRNRDPFVAFDYTSGGAENDLLEASLDEFEVRGSYPLDSDGDGLLDGDDNCPLVANPGQEDADGDGTGDACDACTDVDADGACEPGDNCPGLANPGQGDVDSDGIGDACDACTDVDADGACEPGDNCPLVANPGQQDADGDLVGDACDACTDVDADGACEPGDNCPGLANPGQEDLDGDGIGDACDACTDVDADGACEPGDNCPLVANPGQEDADGDGTGDVCDACTDVDADGACEPGDNCPGLANPGQEDVDSDGIGDACDVCTDVDADGACEPGDNCPGVTNPGQEDSDGDGVGTACDNCVAVGNPTQADFDTDGRGNACDLCIAVFDPAQLDGDLDLVGDLCDNCAQAANAAQTDLDSDGLGDVCDANDAGAAAEVTVLDGDATVRPGEPLFVEVVFQNPYETPILTIEPTCCNTVFTIDTPCGPLAPSHVICEPPVIPRDYRIFAPGETFTIVCDVSERFDPLTVAAALAGESCGASAPLGEAGSPPGGSQPFADPPPPSATFEVRSTLPAPPPDDDCDPSNPDAFPADCSELVLGAPILADPVESAPVVITFTGEPIPTEEIAQGSCTATPSAWFKWVGVGPDVSFTVTGIPAAYVAASSILLNGTAGPIPGSVQAVDPTTLVLLMHGGEAVRSLGTVTVGTAETPLLTGSLDSGSPFQSFRATCPVSIAQVKQTFWGCGIGPELALLVPLLGLLHGRKRSRAEESR